MKLPIYTERMFTFLQYLVDNKINGIQNMVQALASIGYTSNNKTNLRKGGQGFRIIYYQNACDIYGADMNFFFVKSHLQMFRDEVKQTPIHKLKEAVMLVRMELEGNKTENRKVNKQVNKNSKNGHILIHKKS